jgi:hypothetical protein
MGTGLDATFGCAQEEAYGTFKEPSRFLEIDSTSLARKTEYIAPRPLRGRPGIPSARHKQTTRQAEGNVAMEVPTTQFGRILDMLNGDTNTPEKQGEDAAYKTVFPIGVTPPNGKSLTVQINKPAVDGDHAFTYLGAKITSAAFSCDTSGQLKCSLDFLARDVDMSKELKEATYASLIESFDFTQPTVKIGGVEIDAGLIIHSFNLALPIPLKAQRYGLGHGATQLEPHGFNDTMLPTWELNAEFSSMELYDFYVEDEPKAVEISFVGETIVGAHKNTITFLAPVGKFVGSDPEVGGPDVLDQAATLEVYDNITNPLVTITTISADSAL